MANLKCTVKNVSAVDVKWNYTPGGNAYTVQAAGASRSFDLPVEGDNRLRIHYERDDAQDAASVSVTNDEATSSIGVLNGEGLSDTIAPGATAEYALPASPHVLTLRLIV